MTYTQDHELQLALGDAAARQLANATKTVPQLLTISPRWFVRLLHWLPVEAGIYRLNKVRDASRVEVACSERFGAGAARNVCGLRRDPPVVFLECGEYGTGCSHSRVRSLQQSPRSDP